MPQAYTCTHGAPPNARNRFSRTARTLLVLAGCCLMPAFAPAALGASTAAPGDVLRVLKLHQHESNHPHRDTAGEFALLGDFARREGLSIEWLDAHQPKELHARLMRGEADVLVADLPPALARDTRLARGLSLGSFRHYVVGRRDVRADSPPALAGHRVAVRLSSPLWPYFNQLQHSLPDVTVVVLPADTTREALLRGAVQGRYDAAVISARPGENPVEAMPRLTTLFALSNDESATWYFRKDRVSLRARVDGFLQRYHAAYLAPPVAPGKLEKIDQRGVLRVITRIDPQNYFIRNGKPAGFELEFVRMFARERGLGLEFLVGETDQQILEWLRSGAADIVTTRVDAGEVRVDPALVQSTSYFHSASVVVSRTGSDVRTLEDLAGRRVAVLANTVHHRALGALVAAGTAVVPILINPDTPLDDVLAMLENWAVDAAIVDAYAVADIRSGHPLITAGVTLPAQFNYAWTTRARDAELGRSVDEFLREQFRKKHYNILAERYFGRSRYAQFASLDRLSPYDALVQRHAETHDFDWRLIVAQMYQESRFDPDAISTAGAVGLMQMLPATARAMGVSNPADPESGIRGGIKYLGYLRDRFDAAVAPRERTWFALAAYNVGFHRVSVARERAKSAGLDPNRWFGHVEVAMRAMTRDDSPCRCGQTVVYVRAIRSLYNTYHRLHDVLTAGVPGRETSPTG